MPSNTGFEECFASSSGPYSSRVLQPVCTLITCPLALAMRSEIDICCCSLPHISSTQHDAPSKLQAADW